MLSVSCTIYTFSNKRILVRKFDRQRRSVVHGQVCSSMEVTRMARLRRNIFCCTDRVSQAGDLFWKGLIWMPHCDFTWFSSPFPQVLSLDYHCGKVKNVFGFFRDILYPSFIDILLLLPSTCNGGLVDCAYLSNDCHGFGWRVPMFSPRVERYPSVANIKTSLSQLVNKRRLQTGAA